MARVTIVKKAQKDQGTCEKCGVELAAGSSYPDIDFDDDTIRDHPHFDAEDFDKRVATLVEERVQEKRDEWADEQERAAEDAISNIDF
jgi:hypothetical protein